MDDQVNTLVDLFRQAYEGRHQVELAASQDPDNPTALDRGHAQMAGNEGVNELFMRIVEQVLPESRSMEELGDMVWAVRAFIYDDLLGGVPPSELPLAALAPGQLIYAAALRVYFATAERLLGRPPWPAELDDIEAGFCDPDGGAVLRRGLARGRVALARLVASQLPWTETGDPPTEGDFVAQLVSSSKEFVCHYQQHRWVGGRWQATYLVAGAPAAMFLRRDRIRRWRTNRAPEAQEGRP